MWSSTVGIFNKIHDEIYWVELKNAVSRLTRTLLWLLELSAWMLAQEAARNTSGTIVANSSETCRRSIHAEKAIGSSTASYLRVSSFNLRSNTNNLDY
jgi:hypothetical protein